MKETRYKVENDRLNLKYQKYALLPLEAIGVTGADDVYLLSDGNRVKFEYLTIWDNTTQVFNDEIGRVSNALYGVNYDALCEIWAARVTMESHVWCKVRMKIV